MVQNDIQRTLGRIEGTISGIASNVEEIKSSHNKRIVSLELWRAFLTGGWVVTMALVGYLFTG